MPKTDKQTVEGEKKRRRRDWGVARWDERQLTMTFDEPLRGGVPRSGDMIATWLGIREATPAQHKRLQETPPGPDGAQPATSEEVLAEKLATVNTAEDDLNRAWVGFQNDEKGIFVRGSNVRAHLKDAADALTAPGGRYISPEGSDHDISLFRHKFVKAIYIQENRLHVLRPEDGSCITKPDGYKDCPMHVMTARGERECLKRVDWIHPAMLVATVLLWTGGEITWEHVEHALEYGAIHGFGQDRSLGYGRYAYRLIEIDEAD